MQKTALTTAAALALATFGAGTAFAQSSLTLYGNADVSVDHVKKTAGVPLAVAVIPPAFGGGTQTLGQGKDSSTTRVSPSGSSQTSFGFKGEENLGDGYKASFVLEGQLSHDTGALAQDGRIFGRQSYVGLTTPFGEVRLGRQYAPIFYSTAFVTGERFGVTDLFIEGGATNNLMVRQDNQISYWLKAGGFTGSLAYSPNAGSYGEVNARRATTTTPASAANGGILGAIGAGAESPKKFGRSIGFFGNYAFDSALNATFGYHRNDFDGAKYGSYDPVNNSYVPSSWALDKYQAYNFGVKYVFPSSGIMLDGAFAQGRYDIENSDANLKVQFLAAGIRVPVNQWTFSGQVSQIKFKNFTKGKDTGLMLGAEYSLSKRTTLYARAVQIRDDEGDLADAGFRVGPGSALTANVQGGPDVIATALGLRETPVFAGAGINPGGKTTYIGAGVRHSF
jgi:predicted porin